MCGSAVVTIAGMDLVSKVNYVPNADAGSKNYARIK